MTVAKRVAITGAQGFIGKALVKALSANSRADAQIQLLLIDQAKPSADGSTGVQYCQGGVHEAEALQALKNFRPDVVYHLASVPGALAEKEQALGVAVNLDGTRALIDALAGQVTQAGGPIRFVFASSVAVYGALDPSQPCLEGQRPSPLLTYGTHKLITEHYLGDLGRRGLLDAVSLRLPGIVARPPTRTGHGSAFMSDIFHCLSSQEPYQCPVSPDAQCWWLSRLCCVENLMHAAAVNTGKIPAHRTLQVPAITATVQAVVDAICAEQNLANSNLGFVPDDHLESLFGRSPVLVTTEAERHGFRHDGDLAGLVTQVFKDIHSNQE